MGSIANYQSLTYQPFSNYRNGDLSAVIVNKQMVVHLIHEDVYLPIMFTAWPRGGGPFAYVRATPSAAAPTPPTVAIVTPANGSSFDAPATFSVAATAASTSGGTIASVQFFLNGNSIGTATSSPYTATASGLGSGIYTLTATATDNNGLTASASVQVTVVATPPGVGITSPTNGAIFAAPATIPITAGVQAPGEPSAAFSFSSTTRQSAMLRAPGTRSQPAAWPQGLIR